jgi:hypothetical protein
VLLNVFDEYTFNQTLMEKCSEWVSRIEEARAARPGAGPDNFTAWSGIPEGDLEDSSWFIGHDFALEAEIAEDFKGPRLYAVCASCGSGYWPVIDMPDPVTPSR